MSVTRILKQDLFGGGLLTERNNAARAIVIHGGKTWASRGEVLFTAFGKRCGERTFQMYRVGGTKNEEGGKVGHCGGGVPFLSKLEQNSRGNTRCLDYYSQRSRKESDSTHT